MESSEFAIRAIPGGPGELGRVIARDVGRLNRQIRVRWAAGREEFLNVSDKKIMYRAEGSALHRWLLDPEALRRQFSADPEKIFLAVLRDRAEALTAGAIKKELMAAGLTEAALKAPWTVTQKVLTTHEHVVAEDGRYQWSEAPIDPFARYRRMAPAEAFEMLIKGSKPSERRDALVEAVRGGFAQRTPDLGPGDQQRVRAAQDRQLRIDGARAAADVAAAVEELAFNGADPGLIVEQVRVLAQMRSLMPVGQSGEKLGFDPSTHSPLAGFPDAGSRVTVIRPGYVLRTGDEDVLLGKAVVAEV